MPELAPCIAASPQATLEPSLQAKASGVGAANFLCPAAESTDNSA